MNKKFCAFIALVVVTFGDDYSLRFGSYYGYNSDFMEKLPNDSLNSFLAVTRATNDTKAQLVEKFNDWAKNQSKSVQNVYNEFRANGDALEQFSRAFAEAAMNNTEGFNTFFTPAEQQVYAKYLNIYANQNITQAQECQQMSDITVGLDSVTANSSIVEVLVNATNEVCSAKMPQMNIEMFKIPPNQDYHNTTWPVK